MQRAATLSVLALTATVSKAVDQASPNDLPSDAQQTSSNGMLDVRETNRPFFIQDPTDGLCLSGGMFRRCAVDTLWKVEGEAGSHLVRHLAVREDGEGVDILLTCTTEYDIIHRQPCGLLACCGEIVLERIGGS